ncbi:uncharacterized protein [Arachis hypogaea]|uniref:uncharacterized protein n=2 Tax=Arachis TaxID=3817 RepID=UPI000DEC6914|nr:uncharacterized protein LOC112721479 [Arachis hypogaea]
MIKHFYLVPGLSLRGVFHYEDDAGGKIKCKIMQRIGKNWKDTRHNLHKCYKETRTFKENLKHRPSGIEENEWKRFLEYRQKEETKEKEQGRSVGRGELFIITHKKKNGSYIHPDARVVSVKAIADVKRQDESSKHISQNDSLAQVLGKEHPRRVRALGAGPCPIQIFGNAIGQPSGSGEPNQEYERRIVESTAKIEEE